MIETLFTAILDKVIASVIVVKISGIDLACATKINVFNPRYTFHLVDQF